MNFQIFNTLTRKKEVFTPIINNEVKIYTCGPTVYNYAHIGNFRAYIFEDLLRRALKYYGYKVTQVMNITDVDDKTIKNSNLQNLQLAEYTEKYKQAFFEDLKTLNIEKAEYYPEATKHINEIIELIKILIDKKFAYKSSDNSIYFSVKKFKKYGDLSKIDLKNQKTTGRIKSDEYDKNAVSDFALWKAWTQNDGKVFWDSPWGIGRPGWHIECSAMSIKYLGKNFDMHTGGIDNMFPHHENEIAQSEAAYNTKFVNYWLHCEHLLVNGEKMSKSLGNFYALRDILSKNIKWNEIRWVLISTHYRKKLNFTFEACTQARDILKSFEQLFLNLNEIINLNKQGIMPGNFLTDNEQKFKKSIGDDLNISEAIAALFNTQSEANKLIACGELGSEGASKILNTFKKFNTVLGVFEFNKTKYRIPKEIQEMLDEREQARKIKNFKKADEIRNKIKSFGWEIEDTINGPRLKKQ